MDKKIKFTVVILTLILVGVASYGILQTALPASSNIIQAQDSTKFSNPVTYTLVKADGSVLHGNVLLNTVTNKGKNFTRDSIAGIGNFVTGAKCLELSTSTNAPAATDTACPLPVTTNNMTITCATTVTPEPPSGNYSVSFMWVATGTVSNIAKVCLSNSSSSPSTNSLFASALLSPTVTVGSGDQLTVNYYVGLT